MSTNLQTRLKEETAELHAKSEQHPLMQSFVTGTFNKAHLLDLLINLLPIYQTVEQRLIPKEILENPELKRSTYIQKDIDKLITDIGYGKSSLKDITINYVSSMWVKHLGSLRSDLYLRWLADFYGGRILSRSQAPYNATYEANDPAKVINQVRHILTKDFDMVSDDDVVLLTKEFFQFHIDLFEEIWTN